MSDFDACVTARACGDRARVSAVGAHCDRQFVTRGPKRGAPMHRRTTTHLATAVFGSAACGCGDQPTATTERQRQRPSESLM